MNPDDELVVLPPLPDLRTPDQITKAEQKRNFRNTQFAVRQAENMIREEARKAEEAAEINNVPPDPSTALIQVESQKGDAYDAGHRELPDSANGGKLKPFGDTATFIDNGEVKFKGGQEVAAGLFSSVTEETIIELPPLPDLRTPDQITKVDQKRSFRNTLFASRSIKNASFNEMGTTGEVITAPLDPSTALIQVESKKAGARDFGNRERPDTVNGGNLKPFNSDSTFIEGCEVKFKWSDHKFVETQPDPVEDELGILPPLPDLRTPDQVTTSERMRNLRNLKFRGRQAKYEADRRAAEEASLRTLDPF